MKVWLLNNETERTATAHGHRATKETKHRGLKYKSNYTIQTNETHTF